MCVLRASKASCWRSNTSFVLVGDVAQHPPGEAVPWSMVATCWRLSPWCLQHRRTGPRFFSCQLPPSPAHHAALYFWMQNLTDHIELQSIFLLLWRSKRALFVCISFLQLRSLSVITLPCGVHLCSFICECLLSLLLVRTVCVDWKEGLLELCTVQQADINVHVFVCRNFFQGQYKIGLFAPIINKKHRLISPSWCISKSHSKQIACQVLNGDYKHSGFVWLLSMFDEHSECYTRRVCVSVLLK